RAGPTPRVYAGSALAIAPPAQPCTAPAAQLPPPTTAPSASRRLPHLVPCITRHLLLDNPAAHATPSPVSRMTISTLGRSRSTPITGGNSVTTPLWSSSNARPLSPSRIGLQLASALSGSRRRASR